MKIVASSVQFIKDIVCFFAMENIFCTKLSKPGTHAKEQVSISHRSSYEYGLIMDEGRKG
jgi:hypothetical protein